MTRLKSTLLWLVAVLPLAAQARGVSPYLPLNLEPEIEAQIERVLILADKPVMTRPIAAAAVLDALPKACSIDAALCTRVRNYLNRYMHRSGVTHASIEGAASSGRGTGTVAPNRYGMLENSHWDASAQTYVQPNDYLLVDLGAVAYDGRVNLSGSMVSAGFDRMQLDIGFRAHWFSPMTDSSMLMSTEAATMPSVTLSNYKPLTRLGLHYEIFEARMSNSDHIVYETATSNYTSGKPYLGGLHVSMEPVSGWSFGLNRLVQFGGGARGGASLSTLFRAFVDPSRYSNLNPNLSVNQKATNQEGSITSSVLFPGKVPFAVYAEYAGEDTSRGRNYLLGNSALSVGIHFPLLWERFDLTLETTEWQNAWYVHSVWQDGMTNYGRVVSNWFGDQRIFGDGIGGNSQMVRLGWEPWFGGSMYVRFRTLQNASYGQNHYDRFHEVTLGYSRPWHGVIVGGEVDTGRDVFGENFARLAGFLRYDEPASLMSSLTGAFATSSGSTDKSAEIFVDAGYNVYRVRTDLTKEDTRTTGARKYGPHFAVGARRAVSEHNDLGTRVEYDNVDGHSLLGVRLIDYRYRFNGPLAVGAFLGAARFNLATPAYGVYYGLGAQWRNILRGWDLGAEFRYEDSIARDHLLPGDPVSPPPRNDSFYDIWGVTVSLSHHF